MSQQSHPGLQTTGFVPVLVPIHVSNFQYDEYITNSGSFFKIVGVGDVGR